MAKADAPAAPAAAAAGAAAPSIPLVAPAAPAKRFSLLAWLPAVATILLAPTATWAVVEFWMLPRLQHQIAIASDGEAPAAGAKGEKGGKEGEKGEGIARYEFNNVVVNLAGTMGTRYLKTSFIVTGADGDMKTTFDENKPRLTDVTLNVLSALTLADLEEPGAKNVIREKLVAAYNQALNKKVAEQVYFSDFVIQ